jgi:hypothetical protein
MTSFTLVIAGTAFLAGAAVAVFLMIVIGIRKADRPRHQSGRNVPVDAFTRNFLGASPWPGSPVVHGDREGN